MIGSRPEGSLVPPADWAAEEETSGSGPGPGFLVMATFLAAVLRLYALTGQSLWVDEMLTWQMIQPGISAGFWEQIRDSIQGPLYMAVVWPLIRLQDSALMMRLPAAVAGIATIPLFGVFVGRLVNGRAARLAVLLLAVNPFHVWYSQEARGYAFLMMFSVLMALAFLALARQRSGSGLAVAFALATAGAVLSNLGGMFLWAGMGLGLLLFYFPSDKRQWGLWTLAFGLGLLLVSPWLLKASGIWAVDRIVPGSGTGDALRGETTFTFLAWPYSLQTFFYGYSLGPSLRELHQPDRMAVLRAAWPVLVLGALPVGLGLLVGIFRGIRKQGMLIVWIVVPIMILTFLAMRNVKPWNPRYVAMVLPWVLVLAACGLAALPRRLSLSATVLLTCLTLWSLVGYYGNGRYAKADVRAAARYLEETNVEGAVVLAPVITSVFNYYYGGAGEVLDTYRRPPLKDAAEAADFFDEVLAGRGRVWLVQAREWYFDPGGYLPAVLSQHGRLRVDFTAPGVKVYDWYPQPMGDDAP